MTARLRTGLLLLNLVQVTATVAVSGGANGPMWLLFVSSLLFAGMSLQAAASICFGVVITGCLVLAAAISHSLDGQGIVTVVVAGTLFPVLSWYASGLGTMFTRLNAASEAPRAREHGGFRRRGFRGPQAHRAVAGVAPASHEHRG